MIQIRKKDWVLRELTKWVKPYDDSPAIVQKAAEALAAKETPR